MTTKPRRLLTGRDLEVLTALDRTPLTASQLLKLSRTFAHPFGSERMVRERLAEVGRLPAWRHFCRSLMTLARRKIRARQSDRRRPS